MPLAPGTRLGPYEIVAPLGTGGMGEVYRARDSRLKREVALKVLPERTRNDGLALERFRREAQLLAGLNHPHIAAVYGFDDGALAMELVEGETLADRLRRGKLPAAEALVIARQLAEALEYAHDRGIIHRDLKPANIKLTPDDKVKVLDFGLAKALTSDASGSDWQDAPTLTTPATLAGAILGTAAYMAPEQARGKAVDRRADIWAFGAVWFEMLTGSRAFAGDTTSDVLAAVIRAEPDWDLLPADLPAWQRRLLERCLRKDPQRRQQSMGDARLEIEEPPASVQAEAQSQSRGRRAWPWWILAGVVGLALGALGAAQYWRTPVPSAAFRFALNLPSGVTPGYGLAVAPDGTRVVFAASQNGRASLWLRDLDAETATPLPGTEDGELPFWSPDGKSIGFFAGAALKRLDLDGGPPRILAPVAAGGARGGSWSPQGVIVFSPDILQPLQKIAASGGTPTPATTLVAQRGDAGHRWPSFLPDGDHFIYSAESVAVGATTIAVGSLSTGKSQPLFTLAQQDSQVLYASGHLLYSQGGALVAQPFDAAHLHTTGAPRVVASHVSPEGFAGPTGYLPASVSPSGVLAFRRGTLAASQLEIVDRSGKQLHAVDEPGEFTEPQLSPDGKRIALGLPDSTAGDSSLWLIDVASGNRSRFTFDKANHIGPIWSPDGRWIYYEANGTGSYQMYRKLADNSGEPEYIFKGGGYLTAESVSRDGRIVTYSDTSNTTSTDLWWLPVNPGAQPQPGAPVVYLRTPAREIYSALSPDGQLMAYQSDANGGGDWEVYVGDFPHHASQWQVSSGGGYWPKWSADGRELYFYSNGNLMAVSVSAGPTPQFGRPKALFAFHPPESLTESSPDYSPLPGGKGFMIDQLLGGDTQAPIEIMSRWETALQHY